MSAHTLHSLIVTTKDVDVLQNRLTELKRQIYSTSKTLDQYISEIFINDQSRLFYDYLSDKKIDSLDPVRVEEAIDELLKNISEMPVVTIRVAFVPSREILSQILSKIQDEIGVKTVLNIVVTDQIIGGAIFESNGIEFSETLAEKIERRIVA